MALNELLKELFLVDQQVRGLESRLTGARTHVNAQQIKINQLTEQHTTLDTRLKHVQVTESGFEKDATGFETRINELRDRMNNATTNKEYSAMLVEINTLKTEKAKVEEQAIELMGQVEQLKAEVAEVEAKIAEQEKIKAHGEAELESRTAEVADQLEQLKQKRRVAAEAVPEQALGVFEKMADALDGEAMAPVEQEDPRRLEFNCGGCYMAIPMEQVNKLGSSDTLVQCTSCRCILYLSDELRGSLAGK